MAEEFTWDEMKFWDSGEWQVIEEKLDDLDRRNVRYNPARESLFAALDIVEFNNCRVAIFGQDPYPQSKFATGIAFSIPKRIRTFPVTLANIFREYCEDLHYPYPKSGDLTPWCKQGVLLWNVIPSCEEGISLSHDWDEWTFLSKEIIERLSMRGVVMAFLGGVAREYVKYVVPWEADVIQTSHPSPRGKGKSPFFGSRLFSTINDKLVAQGLDPIDWRL